MTTTVGELPAATSIAATDLIPVEQGGVLKRATPTLLPFTQSGTGASSRPIQTKLREWVSVTDYGATGDGATDDTTAFNNALAAATYVYAPNPSVGYKLTSKLTIPTSTFLYGAGKHTCKLLHAYNGTFCELGSQAGLWNLYIEGQGATFTGKGVVMSIAGNGKQRIHSCKIINFASACIAFDDIDAGSQFSGLDIETYQVSGGTGTGNYAVTVIDSAQLSATPRAFHQVETSGNCSFSFGGSNDTFVTDSFMGDLAYSSNSRSVHIGHSRIANQTALTVSGANHSIVGCDVLPVITLSAGTTSCVMGPNSWNTAPFVTDSSASSTNTVTHPMTTYTPTLTQSTSNPTLNNSTLTGRYTREGGRISGAVEFTVGSTISFGTGNLQFSLPVTRVGTDDQKCGQILAVNSGTPYTGIVEIPGAQAWARMQRDGTGVFTQASPAAWATGATMRFAFSYSL